MTIALKIRCAKIFNPQGEISAFRVTCCFENDPEELYQKYFPNPSAEMQAKN